MGLSCLFQGLINETVASWDDSAEGGGSADTNPRGAAKSVEVEGFHRFCVAACAGGLAHTLTYPLDVVRARLSARHAPDRAASTGPDHGKPPAPLKTPAGGTSTVGGTPPPLHSVTREIFAEGAAFRGLGVTLLTAAPMIGLTQSSYELLKNEVISKELLQPGVVSCGLCGGLAGIVAQTVVFPLDTVRRRIQVLGGLGTQLIGRADFEFISGLYRGWGAAIVKVLPGVAVSLTVRDWLLGRF